MSAAAAAGGAAAASALRIETEAGAITLQLRPDAAPETVKYILQCVASRLYDGREFYRSDFVIQFGLHGSGVENPHGNLSVNETSKHAKLSNLRGSCSVAHWDVPDCAHSAPQSWASVGTRAVLKRFARRWQHGVLHQPRREHPPRRGVRRLLCLCRSGSRRRGVLRSRGSDRSDGQGRAQNTDRPRARRLSNGSVRVSADE
jgi:hypothetical protein